MKAYDEDTEGDMCLCMLWRALPHRESLFNLLEKITVEVIDGVKVGKQ